jgi:hypothetical protein
MKVLTFHKNLIKVMSVHCVSEKKTKYPLNSKRG